MLLGGVEIAPETLNAGYLTFYEYCSSCHGLKGDGVGGRAALTGNPPRDLTSGLFKFKSTPKNRLPTDVDLHKIIRGGLPGSAMRGFAGVLSEREILNVTAYLKTLSPRWQKERPGNPIPIVPDPWKKEEHAIASRRGRDLYHSKAQCWRCHETYISNERMVLMAHADNQAADIKYKGEVDSNEISLPYQTLPVDLSSARFRAGSTSQDIYQTLSIGVGGTPMGGLYRQLSVKEIWAIVHFLLDLISNQTQ